MTEHFNQLTPGQVERLAILAEECGEVIQAVGKILRHGYISCNPYRPEDGSNREILDREISDLMAAIDLIGRAGDIDNAENIHAAMVAKARRLKEFTHHQEGFL